MDSKLGGLEDRLGTGVYEQARATNVFFACIFVLMPSKNGPVELRSRSPQLKTRKSNRKIHDTVSLPYLDASGSAKATSVGRIFGGLADWLCRESPEYEEEVEERGEAFSLV